MSKNEEQVPFQPLGKKLKALRARANETIAEASGAVEIDVRDLASFELGQKRPSEDVLLLLISHFGAQDDEAVKLWEMAGYGMNKIPIAHMSSDIVSESATSADNRVLFTDIVDVVVNNYGVVMNFMQSGAPGTPTNNVARVGMSREHAKSVLEILQITLNQTEHSHRDMSKKLSSPDSNNQSQQ